VFIKLGYTYINLKNVYSIASDELTSADGNVKMYRTHIVDLNGCTHDYDIDEADFHDLMDTIIEYIPIGTLERVCFEDGEC
jgi:hypothetical protein